jgi:Flp pilus assembly protein CpaB
LRPDWTRTVLTRRVAAGALVLLAGIATLRSNPDGDRAEVVVAARDLRPGAALTADDVRIEKRLATTIPDGSSADSGAVVGSTLASPTRRGEVLTDVRLLGSRLAEATAGPGARIVPLHLADNALIDLVRVGDVVDVLAAPPPIHPRRARRPAGWWPPTLSLSSCRPSQRCRLPRATA